MVRALTIAAVFALALPTLAAAQGHEEGHPGAAKRAAPQRAVPHGGPPPGRPAFVPHGPGPGPGPGPHVGPALRPVPMAGPHPGPMGGPHAQFGYHGHYFNPVHISPFIYPSGWAYRRWAVGAILPPIFLAPQYYYPEWAALGLDPPPPGTQWLRYGPDLLLVDLSTGNVLETVPDVFYDQ
jgi:hypothetical protein